MLNIIVWMVFWCMHIDPSSDPMILRSSSILCSSLVVVTLHSVLHHFLCHSDVILFRSFHFSTFWPDSKVRVFLPRSMEAESSKLWCFDRQDPEIRLNGLTVRLCLQRFAELQRHSFDRRELGCLKSRFMKIQDVWVWEEVRHDLATANNSWYWSCFLLACWNFIMFYLQNASRSF